MKLTYYTPLTKPGKCIIWKWEWHIPPGLLSVCQPSVVLAFRSRLFQRCHFNYLSPLCRRCGTSHQIPTFGGGHTPCDLPSLRPPLSIRSHGLTQCSDIHLPRRHGCWRRCLPLAAAIPRPHHLRHRRQRQKHRTTHHNRELRRSDCNYEGGWTYSRACPMAIGRPYGCWGT